MWFFRRPSYGRLESGKRPGMMFRPIDRRYSEKMKPCCTPPSGSSDAGPAPSSGRESCCCGPAPQPAAVGDSKCACTHGDLPGVPPWQDGTVPTPVGPVPRVATALGWSDRLGGWKVRWGIGRGSYRVPPGLYAAGSPGPSSPVLVTANFKVSFDRLRAVLGGIDGWILVLDTKGVNVWCAAGKGTFGTDELVRRLEAVRLAEVVDHRKLILPQLGATGVSTHRVEELSGWRVRYGPVRASDVPSCLDSGRLHVKPEMRRVTFTLAERAVLVPVELVLSFKYLLAAAALIVLLSGLGPGGYGLQRLGDAGVRGVVLLLAGWLGGGALGPLLLPWLPGRAFSVKGAWVGLALVLAALLPLWPGPFANLAEAGGWLLIIPAVASFMTMNFTGASTFTSLSGVRREMRLAVPVQIVAVLLGLVLWTMGRFI